MSGLQESGGPVRLGLRAYARHRGCAPPSVARAIASQRLKASVTFDAKGHPLIDPVLADQEWARNTDWSKAPATVKEQVASRVEPPVPPVTPPVTPPGTLPLEQEPLSLTEASAEEKRWKALQAELNYRRQAGELVEASAVAAAY